MKRNTTTKSVIPQTPVTFPKTEAELRLGKLYDVHRLLIACPRFKDEELSRFVCRVAAHALETVVDELRTEVMDTIEKGPRE